MHESSPAMMSLKTFLKSEMKNRRGRPRISLPQTLVKDVRSILGKKLDTIEDLEELKILAREKKYWTEAFTHSTDLGNA